MSTNKLPHVWLVRAGGHGEDEDTALTEGLALIGFQQIGDLTAYKGLDDISAAIQRSDHKSTSNEHRAMNYARQLLAFRSAIQEGDTAVLPLKLRSGQVALGVVAGPYKYVTVNDQHRHTRKVKWVKPDIARSVFQQDLLYSF